MPPPLIDLPGRCRCRRTHSGRRVEEGDATKARRPARHPHGRTCRAPSSRGLVAVAIIEFRRWFNAVLATTHPRLTTLLAWAVWRRRHQARAGEATTNDEDITHLTVEAVVLAFWL